MPNIGERIWRPMNRTANTSNRGKLTWKGPTIPMRTGAVLADAAKGRRQMPYEIPPTKYGDWVRVNQGRP